MISRKQKHALDNDRMRGTVRDILHQIDLIFAAGSNSAYDEQAAKTARQLWDVLSALRGPDTENGNAKCATTIVIRAACFPKTFLKNEICIPALMDNDDPSSPHVREYLDDTAHFTRHARKAFDVLGLSWATSNTPAEIANAAKPFRKTRTRSTK
jgi:hypothetical protein